MSSAPSPSLARVVGLGGAVWLGLGSILGTGVFVSLGIAAGVGGSGLLVAVVLAALVATANGLSSAQLAANHPVSGGTYEYAHRLIHPAAGYAAGWLFLLAKSASAATAALGCAGYLLLAAGVPGGQTPRTALALGIVGGVTALVAGGMRRSNRANAIIVSATVSVLALFVLAGWVQTGAALRSGGLLPSSDTSLPAILHATALMFVAYTGYGRIATLGEEVKAPATTIPRAVVATLALSMLLYVGVAATALAAVGPDGFAGALQSAAAPLQVVAQSFRPAWVAPLVGLGAIAAMTGVLLNLILGLSRVVLAMARRGDMPAPLAAVEAKRHSPRRAVWAVGGLVAALVLVGDLKTTWSFSAFTVLAYYGLTNLSALRLPVASRRFPVWVPIFGLISCAALAFFVEPAIWAAGSGLLAVGFVLRSWIRRAR